VRNRIVIAAVAALAVGGLAACSPAEPNHPSQATVTINGNTVANKQRVTCTQQTNNLPGAPLETYWMITIGDQTVAGVKATLKGNGGDLVANSVHIQNLGGFTGAYAKDDGGDANATFSAETFTITGTAMGSNTYQPGEPAKASFKIVATC
jgi:hypothetical protein